MRVSWPSHSASRSMYFWIFPVAVLGRSRNSTYLGALKWAMRSRVNCMTSFSATSAPARGHDESLGHLAPSLVGDSDHADLEHARVLHDDLLDLLAGDVLTAGYDDVLGAVLQLDVAVGVPDGDVTRVEPSALECGGRGFGVVEVA